MEARFERYLAEHPPAPPRDLADDKSPMVRIILAWPSRPWLNALVSVAFFFTLILYYFGRADLVTPFTAFVAALWLLCFAGRLLVWASDARKRRRNSR